MILTFHITVKICLTVIKANRPKKYQLFIFKCVFSSFDFEVKCDLDTQRRIFDMFCYHTILTCQTRRCLTQGHTSLRAEEFCDTLYVCPFHHLFNIFDILAVGTVKPLATFLQHSEKDNKIILFLKHILGLFNFIDCKVIAQRKWDRETIQIQICISLRT